MPEAVYIFPEEWTEEESTNQLRWRAGKLQQLWKGITRDKSGSVIRGRVFWRDVPTDNSEDENSLAESFGLV